MKMFKGETNEYDLSAASDRAEILQMVFTLSSYNSGEALFRSEFFLDPQGKSVQLT